MLERKEGRITEVRLTVSFWLGLLTGFAFGVAWAYLCEMLLQVLYQILYRYPNPPVPC